MNSALNHKLYDVIGIGNAIVDVLSFTEEAFLERHGLVKSSMTLIDEAGAAALYEQVGPSTECSGGSVANSMAGLASLGAKGTFIGKVRDDQLGSIFRHDMHAVGVSFDTPPTVSGPSTASCLVFVTPDAQRTMVTYIGACSQVSEADIDEDSIRNAKLLYIEGYLWDTDQAKAAIRKAIAVAKTHDCQIALTLSDTFCVERHRDTFLELIKGDIGLLFANEAELHALFSEPDFERALQKLRAICPLATVTRGAKGSVVVTNEAIEAVPAGKVADIVDTTGAGDLYASGFLYGVTRGWPLTECARLGNRCAGEIITQIGARSLKPLDKLVA